ncbi:MAG: hypothetical protein OEQ16_08955 [Gammaproteobacteria bacterium]|jgi:hypothetical protein|nr:hypothetical protein [Gammaproteobacteria bacterium]MDH3819831.1 hypothetical protein [Gammaproteobacteria bacterium]
MTKEFDDKLDRTAQQLATEISPERDLWPGIAEAIAAPKRSRWTPMLAQAAAVVLLVGASSAVTYIATKDSSGPVVSVAPELVFEQAAFGGNYHLGPGFQDARNSLRDDLDIELARLSDAAREDVQANLELIHQAIIEINKALEQEPDNVLLQQKLLQAYREELTLLRRVGGLTRDVMRRNDI